jgi:hypothetical protein
MPATQSKLYSQENVLNMISVMHNLIDDSAQIYNNYNNKPAADSIAVKERKSFPNKELSEDVHYRGILSIEAAADHLMVFTDSISEPAKTIAPWTCVRGSLESCALAIWFLDPTIDARERVGRCFAFRYSGFVEQIKFLQVNKASIEIGKVQQRMIKVEQDVISLGYPKLMKGGNINGIAMHMPSIIDLIRTTLNREGEYRLLSGIAHGHHWAISQISFQRVVENDIEGQFENAFEKYLHPEFVLFATDIAVSAYAKVLWYLWHLYGWDIKEIENFLDGIYDKLNYKTESRFWHNTSNGIPHS